jgi:hypothetical protein
MGVVESTMGQEGPLMADPCVEVHMMSNNKNTNDICQNNWLELQDQAKFHDRHMKELVASHVEDQKRLSKWRLMQANRTHQK